MNNLLIFVNFSFKESENQSQTIKISVQSVLDNKLRWPKLGTRVVEILRHCNKRIQYRREAPQNFELQDMILQQYMRVKYYSKLELTDQISHMTFFELLDCLTPTLGGIYSKNYLRSHIV